MPSRRSPTEVAAWFALGPSGVSLAGAKNPTSSGSDGQSSGTIQESLRISRKVRSSRGLPRETRSSLVEAGLLEAESSSEARNRRGMPTHVPDVSGRESNISE
jgi:hypothetical protein